ncbi:MAG: malonate decarboxylase acyl carrier protein [Chthoniobacterales bacterium]|nr:malonate decarboxylase acyl carrier protein [Chthoniobacterales bacterium]
MEHLSFEFDGGVHAPKSGKAYAVAGVVASSNLEVLAQPQELGGRVRFEVDTTAAHFQDAWRAVITDFIERRQPRDVLFSINDFAAIPPVVSLRLDQAWEGLE